MPDITTNPTMCIGFAPWRNLFHPNEWTFLTQKVEQWGGLLGVSMEHGIRCWAIQLVRERDGSGYRYVLWLPTMGEWTGTWRNAHHSRRASSLEDLIDLEMSEDHRTFLHLAITHCVAAERVAANVVRPAAGIGVSDTQPEAVMQRIWDERQHIVEGEVLRPALPPAPPMVATSTPTQLIDANPYATIEFCFVDNDTTA